MQWIQAASQILPTPTDTCHFIGRLVHAGCASCYLMAEEEPLRWQWWWCNLTRMDQLISRYHQVRAWGSIVLFPFLVRWCKVINLGKECWRYSYIETGQVSMNHRIHVNITHMLSSWVPAGQPHSWRVRFSILFHASSQSLLEGRSTDWLLAIFIQVGLAKIYMLRD